MVMVGMIKLCAFCGVSVLELDASIWRRGRAGRSGLGCEIGDAEEDEGSMIVGGGLLWLEKTSFTF